MGIKKSHDFIVEKSRALVPALRYDLQEDYASWKVSAREKLNEVLGLPLESCEEEFQIVGQEEKEEYTRIDFVFQSEPGYYVPAAFLIPRGADKPLPLSVCIQGHSSGMHISFGVAKYPDDPETIAGGRNFAERAIREGYCAAVLEQRYMGICGQDDLGAPLCARKNAALPSLLLGRTAIGERSWDVQRLMDVLERHFSQYYDPERVVCMGNSGGGTITFYAACLDDRIKLAMPSCSVCEFEDSIIPWHHCCCNYVPGIRKYFEMGDMACLIADRKLVIVCGVLDPDFPVEGVEKSYRRAKAVFEKFGRGEQCNLVKGSAGHQFYPDEAWPIANRLIRE